MSYYKENFSKVDPETGVSVYKQSPGLREMRHDASLPNECDPTLKQNLEDIEGLTKGYASVKAMTFDSFMSQMTFD